MRPLPLELNPFSLTLLAPSERRSYRECTANYLRYATFTQAFSLVNLSSSSSSSIPYDFTFIVSIFFHACLALRSLPLELSGAHLPSLPVQ